jgi:hypothetical protein
MSKQLTLRADISLGNGSYEGQDQHYFLYSSKSNRMSCDTSDNVQCVIAAGPIG